MMDSGRVENGLIMIYTGNGKGKTSAALGSVIRALGWGWKVAVVQFVKGSCETGEYQFFHRYFPDMLFEVAGCGFTSKPGNHREYALKGWRKAENLLRNFDGGLLVLDELNIAINSGLLEIENVIEALKTKRKGLHVIITGRYAREELIAVADMVSEINEIKHQFRNGIPALKGIDF